MLYRFYSEITKINTIEKFSAGQESGKIVGTYLDRSIVTHGTEEDIQLLLDGLEHYFGSPSEFLLLKICSIILAMN